MFLLVFLSLEERTATGPFPNYLKKGRPNLILAPRGNTYFRSYVLGDIDIVNAKQMQVMVF